MDIKTRQVIAFHVGDRSRDSAEALWAKMQLLYREQATFHTARVSRLVCDTLSFSKKLASHIGAIKYFIFHYNLTRAAAFPV